MDSRADEKATVGPRYGCKLSEVENWRFGGSLKTGFGLTGGGEIGLLTDPFPVQASANTPQRFIRQSRRPPSKTPGHARVRGWSVQLALWGTDLLGGRRESGLGCGREASTAKQGLARGQQSNSTSTRQHGNMDESGTVIFNFQCIATVGV